ncbi:unnamed protein product [Phyllotreta striolata]|uniref:COMM domain-containing protein 5 n=1 Tax=Phyllotreta striolata TaxID=444603 RepID=A0A9N9TFY3_PHYSR|nr:unnamed protein product [Phyllotreta striolata]
MNYTELSKASKTLAEEFPNEFRNKILKLAISSYLPTAQDRSKAIDVISRDANVPKEHVYEVLGVYISLLEIFLQGSDNEYNEKLAELGFTAGFLEQLPFLGNREEIINNLQKSYTMDFGRLNLLKWRIDVSLDHSVLAKKVPNLILISLTKKDGSRYTIELEPRMFHKFRFSIALILYELNNLKSK